jgi:endo-1,4-beta-xylanase
MIGRRAVLGSSLALAACGRAAQSQPAAGPLPPLKNAPFPVGGSVMTGHLHDPGFTAILDRNFLQMTPEWEMKMEYILQPDGSLKFDAPDAIAAYARDHGMRLHGHTPIRYAYEGPSFQKLAGDKAGFGAAYDAYIRAVVGRYKGLARSWDVVNEPIKDDASGPRASLWSRTLGEVDHIVRAYKVAQEADQDAVLFLNDYFLESNPIKRATFMRLVDRLLAAGCPLGGIGCQTHIDIDLPSGAIGAALKDLASFGLAIHLSELDISTNMKKLDIRSTVDKLRLQAERASEVAAAFMGLPPRQRFAFTLWGLRDKDSWLRGPNGTGPADLPSMFDSDGAPKPALEALLKGFGL